jgi:DNA-binding NarL/FixJ family response regulator
MRPTRLIYVENDPSLRGIMTTMLDEVPEIDLIFSTGVAHEALDPQLVQRADAALLDLALGTTQMNGIDLGLAMRELNDNIGIVIHSQYRLDTVARTVPKAALIGWTTLPKSGDLDMDELVRAVRDTARGHSSIDAPVNGTSPLESLTVRQRAVMGMAAAGVGTPEIARRLNISHAAARHDLSNAYRVLVPDAAPEDDMRTRAVIAYLELTRHDDAIDGR